MKTIKIILGSVRDNRAGEKIGAWVIEKASEYYGEISFEYIDLLEVNLPFMNEPVSPMASNEYVHNHTKEWSAMIDDGDGFIFITPEYNHGYPAVIKNALDYLYQEWTGKPVAFIGYGGDGAKNSIRQLREVVEFMKMRPIDVQVGIGKIWEAFDIDGELKEETVNGDIFEIFETLDHWFKA